MLADALRKQFTPEATVVESPWFFPDGAHFRIKISFFAGPRKEWGVAARSRAGDVGELNGLVRDGDGIELGVSVGPPFTNHTAFNQMKAVTLISCALQPFSRAGLFRSL
jgi:hypothetical protein